MLALSFENGPYERTYLVQSFGQAVCRSISGINSTISTHRLQSDDCNIMLGIRFEIAVMLIQ